MTKRSKEKGKSLFPEDYLAFCNRDLSVDEYLSLETLRKGADWANLISSQSFKCYYCDTDIRTIQKLILNGFIGLRKRGINGYSGMHLELDHKNANKNDNLSENLVAACYYCNNDKSNTITPEVFTNYFGAKRGEAFSQLILDNQIKTNEFFRHHLKFV